MNIFILSFDPKTCARFHCDKHVVKMILETAQLLYCAHWVLNPEDVPSHAYRKTHPNHPCAIWTRESLSNYTWLCQLGMELCHEYSHRYKKTHKTQAHIEWLVEHPPQVNDIGITEIRQAMPDECKLPNPVKAYQNYYRQNKRKILAYTHREWPHFLQDN